MDLDECYKKGFIKKTQINENLIRSLIDMSNANESTVSSSVLNKTNISPYVSMAYDSLREILEALCIERGYKVTNHICLGELLKKLAPSFDYDLFDRMRYIRNGINYYGTKIDLDEGKEIIKKIFNLKSDSLKLFNKNHSD